MLLVLGVLAPAGSAHGDAFGWHEAGLAVALLAAMVHGGRLLLRPLLRYIANTRMREVFIGFALLLVLGIAALMQAIGLSMALGAFLAGVLLADSEYRHELELDIEPFKGLLLGLFFIAVGMGIDLALVFLRSRWVVLGLALAACRAEGHACSTRSRACSAVRACRRAGCSRWRLSHVGEFAFGAVRRSRTRSCRARVWMLLNAAVAAVDAQSRRC
jgi:glutathione-regulated potassium-efflux system ancillary protein KefC